MFSSTSSESTEARETKENLEKSAEGMQEAAHAAGRSARDFLDTTGKKVSQASDNVTNEIRRNPVRSSMIALGAGVLLGLIWRR